MAYQLSPVNESDEAISLFEILSRLGGTGLRRKELWCLCFQCTRILQDVNKVGDFFQTLCITPESVAFEIATGQICLLDLYVDPDAKYVPPEYEKHGNNEKSHLYSLGWTIIEANRGRPIDHKEDGLSELISCLIAQTIEERPTIQEVINICNSALQNESFSSEKICQELFDRAKKNTHKENLFIPVEENQTSEIEEEKPESKIEKNDSFDLHSKDNEREINSKSVAEKPTLIKKPCLKKRNGIRSPNKKKGTVSFSEANSLINLSITYHSSDENDGENEQDLHQNADSCQVEVTKKKAKFCEVPDSEDNCPQTRIPKLIQKTLDHGTRNGKSDKCISEDFQDLSRPKFQESNVDDHFLQTSSTGGGDFGNSLVAGSSLSKCQNGCQYKSCASNNSRLCCKKDNFKKRGCGKNSEIGCCDSETHSDEEFFYDAKCSDCCSSEIISQNPDMDKSKNSGTKKWQISEDEELQRECSISWADNQRIPRFMTNCIRKAPDPGMVNANQRPDSANGDMFLEESDREISSERSSVELVPLGHANRSVFWNFDNESLPLNEQKLGNSNGNLVDLILGSQSEECINGHQNMNISKDDETVPVCSDNEREKSLKEKPPVPKKPLVPKKPQKPSFGKSEEDLINENVKDTSHDNNCNTNSECNNNDYDGDDDDDSSLLGEILKAKSFKGESAKQKLNRIKEVKATTLQDIIDVTGLYFDETELWALCREALLCLNKTKDIPSYLSLDIVAIQPNGQMLFVDPPNQKLIDITFVAPEIQKKKKITEKTGIYGLGMVLRSAAGSKTSVPSSNLGMSDIMKDLFEDMTSAEVKHRPSINCIYDLCEAHEKKAQYSSQNICQSLYEECVQSLMEDVGERETADLTEESNENEEKSGCVRKANEEETLKESEDNNVGSSNPLSAFTTVANRRLEVPDGENSPNTVPVAFSSSATHFKPIVLNDSWSQGEETQAAPKNQIQQSGVKDGNCRVNGDPEQPLQKATPPLGKRSGSSTETFVSASRRVVEKLRQLEEVYTKQTSKGNSPKHNKKISESEKSECPAKEKNLLQASSDKEPSCPTGQKDQTLGKKDVEELAEVIFNKIQEKQSNFGQFSTLGLFGWNDISLNNTSSKSQVPLMVMPTQRMMTVPFVNTPYPPMMDNGQCPEDMHLRFPAKEPPCPHCLHSSSSSVYHSETSSCQSDTNCCDSLEEDEESQMSVGNFQALRHHSDLKGGSHNRCSVCPSHGRRAQDLVHKLRSRRTKQPKESKQLKCHCLYNKKWSSEASLRRSRELYPLTETWPGHFDMTEKSCRLGYNSEGCPRNRKEQFQFLSQPNLHDQNLSKSQPENICSQEIPGLENSGENCFNRSISEPNHPEEKEKYNCSLYHTSGHHRTSSLDSEEDPHHRQPLYHCRCGIFMDNDQRGFSSSSSPNLTAEAIPVSSRNGNKSHENIFSEEHQKLKQNGRQVFSESHSNSLKIERFSDIAQGEGHHNGNSLLVPADEGNSCHLHNCLKTSEGICYKCPQQKPNTNLLGQKSNSSDSQEVFLETLCSSQTISDGTIKQLHLILKIMKIVQRHLETDEFERNPDEDFVIGAGIASLKGLSWEKFMKSLTTMYPNYKWTEKCLLDIFELINSTTEHKNSLESDSGTKSSSTNQLAGNENIEKPLVSASSISSGNGLCLTRPKFSSGNSITDSYENENNLENGEILASSDGTMKQTFEENILRDSKGLSFDQSEVTVPLPKHAEESQFQLVKKNDDSPRELFKIKLKKQKHESEERGIHTHSDASDDNVSDPGEDNGKHVSDSEFLDEGDTTNCAKVSEKNSEPEEYVLTEENLDQGPFLERETYFSSTSSLEKEEFSEIQISLNDYKKYVHVVADNDDTNCVTVDSIVLQEQSVGLSDVKECLILKESPKEESVKREKVSRHSSVMKRYRSFQESGSLLKVGVIPSSEGDSDRSDFGPCHSVSTEDGNRADEDETPTCSSDMASSPISELSLDGDDLFSDSGKACSPGASLLSDEASVHSFEYFSASEKTNILLPLLDGDSRVVYHSADLVRYTDNTEVMTFLKGIDKSDFASLNTRLKILQQQLMLEGKEWQKLSRFYQNLQSKEICSKSNKSRIMRVYNDLKECEETLNCLRLCRQHLELLIVSKCSIPHDLVYSLTTSDDTKTLELIPQKDNPYLHFHTISAADNTTGMTDTYVLNAGLPNALFANLYTQVSLSEGIIHQFFYCYRYFSSPQQLFSFLTTTYTASKSCSQSEQGSIVQERTLLLLLWWIKDYYSIDFHGNSKLYKMAQEFIQELPKDEKRVADIQTVWCVHTSGQTQELMSIDPKQSFVYTVSCTTKKNRSSSLSASDLDLRQSSQFDYSPSGKSREWTLDHISPTHNSRGSPQRSLFSFNDHSAEILAEQLTLIEQELFQRVHPVQFLNSKYNGFNTSLTIPGWNNPRSIRNKQNSATNLFVSEIVPRCLSVETQIRHAHQISHWVGAELISATSSRAQVSLLTKFLNIAQCCTKIQNFATSMAILDGLENALVRQMPTWKELNTKSLNIFTNLKTFKNSDCIGMYTEKTPINKICHPVIPSILPYLLNVQQCEIGSFTLTNGMYKWSKMRHITRAIDPIRVFRQSKYPFKPIPSLQNSLKHRIEQTCHQDLNVLARDIAAYDDKISFPVHGKSNFHRAMKRIRDKLKTNK